MQEKFRWRTFHKNFCKFWAQLGLMLLEKRWGFPKCGVQCANFYAKCPMTPKSRRWPICMRRRRCRKRWNGRSGKYPSTICLLRCPLRSVVDCHLGPENTSSFPDFALHLSFSFKKCVTSNLYFHDYCPWPKGRGQILFRGIVLRKQFCRIGNSANLIPEKFTWKG